ncbi:alpha-L-iduronidase [Uranotaenia lowii]|uniref:alpha-L-iduronidase n=1 Tax=Uranotaenia lowii TaxID=190385 RepID=UPI00247A3CAA|nr:alpha-L-iduronidase [Uranotaenia lowii]
MRKMCVLLVINLLLLSVPLACTGSEEYAIIDVDLDEVLERGVPFPRFWTSTGLCPPAPRQSTADFLLSDDSLLNLEIIGSLPNEGLTHVRIHWLLEMLNFSHYDDRKNIFYNFTQLDVLLDNLREFGLSPGLEIMGNPADGSNATSDIYAKERKHRFEYFWTDLTMQVASRYINRYGVRNVQKWRFETWNEPDLKGYNVLNFTVNEYMQYIRSVRLGLDAASRLLNNPRLQLRGPAGLFRTGDHHPFCWSSLKFCNDFPRKCPFEIVTFHRKGSGLRADEIVTGGMELVHQLRDMFPNISHLQFANDEADPIASWSTPRSFQANVKYGAILVSTVFQHWSALLQGRFPNLESISHDNAFLSYHPFEFDQRTLLARFQMNLTSPRHVQFIVKPVYSALGMLANSGLMATEVKYDIRTNVSYLVSYESDPFYACILAAQSNDSSDPTDRRFSLNINVKLPENLSSQTVGYVVEALQLELTDPYYVWSFYGKPSYPTDQEFRAMRGVQFPSLLVEPTLLAGSDRLKIDLSVRSPWILSIRICSTVYPKPGPVTNIRIRKVFENQVLIFWKQTVDFGRCTLGYQIWFRPTGGSWHFINANQHTPFLFFQFVSSDDLGVKGHYRVRPMDLLGRFGTFSEVRYFEG